MLPSRSSQLSILLVIPPAAGARQAQLIEAAVEVVHDCAFLADKPVTWSFGAVAVGEQGPGVQKRIAAVLETRRRNAGDEIAPIGYAGAPNEHLTLRELQLELDWAVLNPWDSGLDTVFAGEKRVYLPAGADLNRADARRLYSEAAEVWISGYSPGQARTPGRLYCNQRAASYALPLVYLDSVRRAQIVGRRQDPGRELFKHLRRILRSEPYLASAFVLTDDEQLEILRSFLGRLDSPKGRRAVATVTPLQTFSEYRVNDRRPSCRFVEPRNGPEFLARTVAAGERRAGGLESDDQTRALLRLLGGWGPSPSREPRTRSVRDQSLTIIASMVGHAAINESSCSAELVNGRLAGFTHRGVALLGPEPFELSLSLNGRTRELQTESAVSFELDNARGVRSSFTLDDEALGLDGLRAWIDYFFLEGAPHLVLEFGIDWPHDLPRETLSLEGSRLMTLTVAKLGTDDALGISTYYPDGSGSRATLHGGDEARDSELCSWSILFRGGGRNLTVTHLDPVSKPIVNTPLEITPNDARGAESRTTVRLTLGPSYREISGAELAGKRERRTVMLSPSAIDAAAIEQFTRSLGPLLARYGITHR